MNEFKTKPAASQIRLDLMHKRIDLPTLDPRMPDIYSEILRAARETRAQRQEQNAAHRAAVDKINRIRMRSVTRKFDSELDRRFVRDEQVRRAERQQSKALVLFNENAEKLTNCDD